MIGIVNAKYASHLDMKDPFYGKTYEIDSIIQNAVRY